MPRNQLYVSRVSPKMNLGKILDEVCREKNLDRNKYELRHPGKYRLFMSNLLSYLFSDCFILNNFIHIREQYLKTSERHYSYITERHWSEIQY